MKLEKYYDATIIAPVVLTSVIDTLFPPPVTAKYEAIVWNTQQATGFERVEDFMRAIATGEVLGFDLTCEWIASIEAPPIESSIDLDLTFARVYDEMASKYSLNGLYGNFRFPGNDIDRDTYSGSSYGDRIARLERRLLLDGFLIIAKNLEMTQRVAYHNTNELLSLYRKPPGRGFHAYTTPDNKVHVNIWCTDSSNNEEIVRRAFGFLDSYAKVAPFTRYLTRSTETISITDVEEEKIELAHVKQEPRVFIGHGHDPAWRDLKDHLQDKHGIRVIAYESGERGGHAIRDILEELMSTASLAFLVLTKEDETLEGAFRARQNVVHEAGLFQGRLGFTRAIVISQEGTEVFSNIAGVHQLRFRNKINEIFGDALAVYRREFGLA